MEMEVKMNIGIINSFVLIWNFIKEYKKDKIERRLQEARIGY